MCGKVKNLHMGLNKITKMPCGFCFVEYYSREEAKSAIDTLNLILFDGNKIRVDWDYGFSDARQFGRGQQGGSRRKEIMQRQQQNNFRKRNYNDY